MLYRRLQSFERYPLDAVVVSIRAVCGQPMADVAAVEVIAEFPQPVSRALELAERLRSEHGLRWVAIDDQDGHWRAEWGSIAE